SLLKGSSGWPAPTATPDKTKLQRSNKGILRICVSPGTNSGRSTERPIYIKSGPVLQIHGVLEIIVDRTVDLPQAEGRETVLNLFRSFTEFEEADNGIESNS